MHTSDQINAATIADTPRQGGTFRNFYVNHTEFRCGTKEQPDTPRQGDVNHTEFRCGSKSSTAAKNIGGDESAGMILRPKQNHRHVREEPSGTFMSTILNSAVERKSNLTPHVREMSTILNSAVEANLQRPPKISEEMKVPE